jgi:hypothetical protein
LKRPYDAYFFQTLDASRTASKNYKLLQFFFFFFFVFFFFFFFFFLGITARGGLQPPSH